MLPSFFNFFFFSLHISALCSAQKCSPEAPPLYASSDNAFAYAGPYVPLPAHQKRWLLAYLRSDGVDAPPLPQGRGGWKDGARLRFAPPSSPSLSPPTSRCSRAGAGSQILEPRPLGISLSPVPQRLCAINIPGEWARESLRADARAEAWEEGDLLPKP